MKTIAHYVDGESFGGAEQVVLQLIQGIDADRWRSLLLHHGNRGQTRLIEQAEALGVECRIVPKVTRAVHAVQLLSFVRTLEGIRPDIFHAHLTWPLSCKYGILAARIAGIRTKIATAHSRIELDDRWILRVQPRWIARCIDTYIAVSSAVEQQLVEEFGIPKSKVSIVQNAVDVSAIERPRNEDLRRRLSCDERYIVFICVGRLEELKGQRYLIEALEGAPDARAIFVGEGPDQGMLEKLSGECGVSDRVEFLGQRSDVPDLLAASDALVLPSLSEGLPLCILEAMAAGLPVIASDIGGISEVVIDGETGYLVAPKDTASIRDALNRIVDAPENATRMGISGRARAVKNFSVQQMLDAMTKIYDNRGQHIAR